MEKVKREAQLSGKNPDSESSPQKAKSKRGTRGMMTGKGNVVIPLAFIRNIVLTLGSWINSDSQISASVKVAELL